MSTREDYPAGVLCWVDTNQPDAVAAAERELSEDGRPRGVHRRGGAAVLPREGGQARWSVTFAVDDDADDAAEHARRLGGSVLAQPQDAPWVRFAVLTDPAGAAFIASQFVPPTD